jgi:hypothetical protein
VRSNGRDGYGEAAFTNMSSMVIYTSLHPAVLSLSRVLLRLSLIGIFWYVLLVVLLNPSHR